MNEKLLSMIFEEVTSKAQFSSLKTSFVTSRIDSFFLKRGDLRKKLELAYEQKFDKILKDRTFKECVKLVREELGVVYGSFQTSDFKKKEKLLKQINSLLEVEKLFLIHKSSRERIEFYHQIYSHIFSWYVPQKGITDLACGVNPLSYGMILELLGKKINYFAADLGERDMYFLQSFFDKFFLPAQASAYDITSLEFLEEEQFKQTDLVFLFKALDSFEEIKRGFSKKLLEALPQKRIVVSFPTRSLGSQREFSNTHKGWLRKIIEDNSWEYETFEVDNELFFLISKD